jgi:hypothetical protein
MLLVVLILNVEFTDPPEGTVTFAGYVSIASTRSVTVSATTPLNSLIEVNVMV